MTDHEENGMTTAKYHKLKDYNWIVEFDREGTDVVTYGLDSLEFRQQLTKYWEIGFGSFSDICDLDTDVCCFNLGIGHYNSHSKKAFVNIKKMKKQIETFRLFYEANKDTKYKREIRESRKHIFYDDADEICEFCNMTCGVTVFGVSVCEDCFQVMINNFDCSTDEFWAYAENVD